MNRPSVYLARVESPWVKLHGNLLYLSVSNGEFQLVREGIQEHAAPDEYLWHLWHCGTSTRLVVQNIPDGPDIERRGLDLVLNYMDTDMARLRFARDQMGAVPSTTPTVWERLE